MLIILAAAALGAVIQGSAGIGLGLVASPVLLSIDTDFAPGPLLVAGLVIGTRHMAAEWSHLDRPTFGRAILGVPVGAAAAIVVLQLMGPGTLAFTIGLLICLASVLLLTGFQLERTTTTDIITGAGCAFTSLAAALPGPPLVIGFHDLSPRALRCTISLFVACVSVVAMASLAAIGRFGGRELTLLALLVPGLLAGLVASRWTRPWLDQTWFRPAVLTLSFAGGAVLALNQLW